MGLIGSTFRDQLMEKHEEREWEINILNSTILHMERYIKSKGNIANGSN